MSFEDISLDCKNSRGSTGVFIVELDQIRGSGLGVECAAKKYAGCGGVFLGRIAVHGQNIAWGGGFLGRAAGDFDGI